MRIILFSFQVSSEELIGQDHIASPVDTYRCPLFLGPIHWIKMQFACPQCQVLNQQHPTQRVANEWAECCADAPEGAQCKTDGVPRVLSPESETPIHLNFQMMTPKGVKNTGFLLELMRRPSMPRWDLTLTSRYLPDVFTIIQV